MFDLQYKKDEYKENIQRVVNEKFNNINKIKKDKRFHSLSQNQIEKLYNEYSESLCCSWITMTDKILEDFKSWCFKTPFQSVKENHD